MSALMVDEFLADGCIVTNGPARLAVTSAVLPVRGARADVGSLRLTNRGIAVILAIFVTLMVTSVVVIVTSFLSVSNDPVDGTGATTVLTVP